MKAEKDDLEVKYNALNRIWDLYLKVILFIVSILIFMALAAAFIFLAIKEYDTTLVVAVGGTNSIFGIIILHITKSLFKPK